MESSDQEQRVVRTGPQHCRPEGINQSPDSCEIVGRQRECGVDLSDTRQVRESLLQEMEQKDRHTGFRWCNAGMGIEMDQ